MGHILSHDAISTNVQACGMERPAENWMGMLAVGGLKIVYPRSRYFDHAVGASLGELMTSTLVLGWTCNVQGYGKDSYVGPNVTSVCGLGKGRS